MAGKLNEGDVMEGIFAICLADLFAHDRIDKTRVNAIRRQIDPELFRDGRFSKEVWRVQDGSPADNVGVTLNLRLKYNSTNMAFGSNYEPLYNSSSDIGNIDQKISTLVSFTNTYYRGMLQRVKDSYLKNNQPDEVKIVVDADGIAGESSGGNIKGDLEVRVTINGIPQMDKKMTFSLKSGSKTLANLSPYNGIMDVISRFGVQLNSADNTKFRTVLGEQLAQARTPAEKRMKIDLIHELYDKTLTELASNVRSPGFKAAAFKLFRDVTFGEDLANVVDIDKTKIKEITVEHLNALEARTTGFTVDAKGNGAAKTLKFKMVPSSGKSANDVLFQLRYKERTEGAGADFNIKELKFYVEAGAGAYAPKL